MKPVKFAVLGNPVVDAVARAQDADLAKLNLTKGDANILSPSDMFMLGGAVDVSQFESGGSAANVAYTLAKLGHPTCFMGPLGSDPAGRHFFKEMVGAGLTLGTPQNHLRTTELFVLLTPDGVRTMAQPTPAQPSSDDSWLDEMLLAGAEWLLLGGYVTRDWPQAIAVAQKLAADKGIHTVLQLPAPAVCAMAAETLLHAVAGGVSLIIGNRDEFAHLLERATPDQRRALESTPRVVTASGEGATFIAADGSQHTEPTRMIDTPLDNTGAGDAFAAGFLAVYAAEGDVPVALRRGHQLGAAVIQQVGPRLADPKAVWLNADPHVNIGI